MDGSRLSGMSWKLSEQEAPCFVWKAPVAIDRFRPITVGGN